ncbi:hypothetical protein RYH80_03985 [Halobaculum sp. MBLA0147]|uniref:hypothetical protein n=1 Tax=Halobaculum sp. MBLA0147 TaxID=3079934 RepID=UPI003524BF48
MDGPRTDAADEPSRRLARPVRVVAVAVVVVAGTLAGRAVAHSGGLRGVAPESLTVPTWLFLATGGGVVGASFLLASFVTDRSFVRRLDTWRGPTLSTGRVLRLSGRALGLVGLLVVLASGFAAGSVTPTDPIRNATTLVVWVGWWGLVVAATYLVGDVWATLDPFRTVAGPLPSLDRSYPDALGSWPAVAGLLLLVFVEVVTPLADDPRLLATVVAAYGVATLAGAVVFGAETWFGRGDPLARLARAYGRIAPLERTADGLAVRLPGSGATSAAWVDGRDDAALVVAVVFATTYDGFVGTGLWQSLARPFVAAGVPPLVLYVALLVGGFGLFYAGLAVAGRLARRTAATYLTPAALVRRFAPSLLAIAAGYHLAHTLGTTLSLLPTTLAVLAAPLTPPVAPPTLVVPSWIGGVGIAAVLGGHLLAIWIAHTAAYELFPDRMQAIRSQYGITLVMVAYTMVALWIVTTPGGAPPYL